MAQDIVVEVTGIPPILRVEMSVGGDKKSTGFMREVASFDIAAAGE